MNNDEVHEAISNYAPLFYWMHLANGEQYLIPFICQHCGNCCREGFEIPCKYFREPDICEIYDTRPCVCRAYPVYTDFGTAGTDCQGYKLSRQAIKTLGQDTEYRARYRADDIFKKATELQKAIAKLEEVQLPKDFIDRFIELNS